MSKPLLAFGILLTCSATAIEAQEWGDIEADFFLKGDAAVSKIVPNVDIAFCGKHKLVQENIVFDPATKGIANIAVYLLPPKGKEVPVHPDYERTAKDPITLDNKGCRFEPHVLALRTGQKLVIGNPDAVGHNTKVEFFKNPSFNVLVPAGGKTEITSLTKNEGNFTEIQCSIHRWMNAYILVKDDPYVGITDGKGHLLIKNVPAGEWTFIVWHELGGYVNDVTIDGKPTKWPRGQLKLSVKPGSNKLGKIEITPAGLKIKEP